VVQSGAARQWAICSAILPPRAERATEPAFFLVPCTEYSIDDTWDVIGLAGTGSKTLVLNDVFVPDYRMMTFADAAAGRSPGSRHYDNRLFLRPGLLPRIDLSGGDCNRRRNGCAR
jgi:hypothetical protein